ncbi:HAMP domain-containing sensor histidine kinase [Mucilaginibacter sp. CSA2-8R]|uniref:sensor histidine kinase n=1 Tax=Mucilaginibacter sp. CSA2-8R TaxID=3141542 RepID=UPI00315DB678
MKKRITLVIGLMAVCVTSVIGLQLFWNYQNYRNTIKNFDHDINEALRTAVDREMDQRQKTIVKRATQWMNDTSFITITCKIQEPTHQTVFTMRDVHPFDAKEKGIRLSIKAFKPRLKSITPEAKLYFIQHVANNIILSDLKKGFVYYYTQRLGDSLEHAFLMSKVNLPMLKKGYDQELKQFGINSAFELYTSATDKQPYLTQPVNASLRRPYEKEWVKAGFDSPSLYFVRQMKWIVLATLFLIVVIIACFAYTVSTLLSQHKLAELKNNFINNMTHELNTPLASIKITVEALNTFSHTPAQLNDYLGIISYQTEKLTTLTHQILNINKLIRATNTFYLAISLNALVKESLIMMAPHINAGNANVTFDNKMDIAIDADSDSLLNVCCNLIDNALKYNTTSRPDLSITLTRQNTYAVVQFADNGPGIPSEYRNQIFEQFFRIPQGNQHDVKGFGLGLSYVKQVMEAHRGHIKVNDNRPCGSVFTLLFPAV